MVVILTFLPVGLSAVGGGLCLLKTPWNVKEQACAVFAQHRGIEFLF